MNAKEELNQLASNLEAIAYWQQDSAGVGTRTAKLLLDAARWLKTTAVFTCGAGQVGCNGGPDCRSDHK